MAISETEIAVDDFETIHNTLASEFTDRYIQKIHLSAVAFGAPYDPNSPFSDYDTTWLPAAPKPYGEKLARYILSGIFKMRPRKMDQVFTQPFAEQVESITDALHDFPVMAVSGHSPDLQAVLPTFGIARAVAADQSGHYRQNLDDMFRLSHAVATRGLMPLKIGNRHLPNATPDAWSIARAGQLVLNPHFTFPRTRKMLESGIPTNFMDVYNARARADCLTAVKLPSEHHLGLYQSWCLAPNAGPDLTGKDSPIDGAKVSQKVGEATIKMVRDMGVGLLPVYTSFVQGQQLMELGAIIPPTDVYHDTLRTIMEDQADYRRQHGEPNVFYAENLPDGH